MKLQLEAIEGLLWCLGGQKVIALQAILDWMKRNCAPGSPDPREAELVDKLMKDMIARCKKTSTKS